MLWTWPRTGYGSLWNEMGRLQREMNRLLEPFGRSRSSVTDSFPAVNIWTSEDNAVLTAELPGVDPKGIEVSVRDATVTIRGDRDLDKLKEGEAYLRQERGAGTFVRSFSLPFPIDDQNVKAQYRMGILQLVLPRKEEDKPKRISVHAG